MTDDRPNRERKEPNWLDRKLSKDELGKRKRVEEEEKLLREIAAIDRACKHRRLFPHIQMSVPEPQEQEDAIQRVHTAIQEDADRLGRPAAAPVPPPRVPEMLVVQAYYPEAVEAAAAMEARISAVEYKLLAKIRNWVPCVSGISRIEVLEKFLLTAEDIGAADAAPPGHRRLARLEAAVETITYEATLDVQRTFS